MARLLFLTPQLPYPPHQGTSLRNYHIIRGLAARHEITLLSFLEEGQSRDPALIAPLEELCCKIEVIPAPKRTLGQRLLLLGTPHPDMAFRLHSPAYEAALRRLLEREHFDIVQVEGIELARAIKSIRVVTRASKIVFDDHNVETELQRRNFAADLRKPKRWPAALYSRLQIRRLERFERWACRNADWVTVVSEDDRRSLVSLLEGEASLEMPSVTVVPNCIDVKQYEAPLSEVARFDLLFSGKMDYRPNIDAVLWFVDEVWPQIRRERPAATLAVVGQRPHARLERLHEMPGITVTGWVEDIRPYLAGAAVCIMPFRIGSGTRLKLIEAMAAAKAIVSTRVGAEGFPVQDGRQLLLADTAAEFAAGVLRLLEQEAERRHLGEAARLLAQEYDWRRVIPRFDEVYERLL